MKNIKFLSCLLAVMLLVSAVTGCTQELPTTVQTENVSSPEVLGEGNIAFDFSVIDKEGKESNYEIHTDEKTVGAALKKLDIIQGEEGEFGLYIKTVNGQTLDYNRDGMYWAFYINDSYATSGVDSTEIVAGEKYLLKAEK